MQSLLVTGSKGFIGQHLKEYFSKQYQVLAPQRSEIDWVDRLAVEQYYEQHPAFDYLINCASVGVTRHFARTNQDVLLENLRSFSNVFAQRNTLKKFIQLGSGAEYGKPFLQGNVAEEDCGKVVPSDAYGMAKFYAGQALENLGIPGQSVNLRLFGVFGPYEDYQTRFISNAIVRSLLDLPIIVNQDAIFDYLYINDLTRIVDYFLQNPAPQLSYNITAGQPTSLFALAEMVKEVTNNPYDIVVNNTIIKEHYTGNNSRLKAFLPDNFVFTPIKTAITELALWYEMGRQELSIEN